MNPFLWLVGGLFVLNYISGTSSPPPPSRPQPPPSSNPLQDAVTQGLGGFSQFADWMNDRVRRARQNNISDGGPDQRDSQSHDGSPSAWQQGMLLFGPAGGIMSGFVDTYGGKLQDRYDDHGTTIQDVADVAADAVRQEVNPATTDLNPLNWNLKPRT